MVEQTTCWTIKSRLVGSVLHGLTDFMDIVMYRQFEDRQHTDNEDRGRLQEQSKGWPMNAHCP